MAFQFGFGSDDVDDTSNGHTTANANGARKSEYAQPVAEHRLEELVGTAFFSFPLLPLKNRAGVHDTVQDCDAAATAS